MRVIVALLLLFTFCSTKKEKVTKTIKTKKITIENKKIDTALKLNILGAFDTILIKNKFNGQILIAKDNDILLDTCIGLSNFQDSTKIKRTTTFHLASVSKTFTGMMCVKLFEENKLKFEDLVVKYIPQFPYKNITINELLSHTSILPDYSNFITIEKKEFLQKIGKVKINEVSDAQLKYYSNDDIIDYMIKYTPSIVPNSKKEFKYCNTNYVVLAVIIEKITNMEYPVALKKYLFDKFGLKNTFVFNIKDLEKYVPSYNENNLVYGIEKFDLIYGDKNIYSCALDLFLWDNILKTEVFLKKKSIDFSYEPKSALTNELKTYGYGWRLFYPIDDEKIIYHNGLWHGNNTAFVRLIKENAVIIILGNKYNEYIYSHKRFIDILSAKK
jgi:CubicO group peptidase (beta-lactamase class C family)